MVARKSRKNITAEQFDSKDDTYKVAGYVRLSVAKNGQHDDSIATQTAIIENYIEKSRGEMLLHKIYVDKNSSGTSFERKGFQEMLADIDKGLINCVVVKDLSRLGRDFLETGYYIEQHFPSRHVRFVAIADNFDTINGIANMKQHESMNGIRIPITNLFNEKYVRRTKDIINANLSDIEQELLRQQVDIGLVEPRFESITSSLRSWIVPRWYFISVDFPLYKKLIDDCEREKQTKFIHPTDGGFYFDIDGYLNSSIPIEESEKLLLTALMQHSFELYQNGLGYNNLLFMSTVLGDMSLDKSGIYLNLFTIEEPEAHLHPQLQELIHSFFERRHNDSKSIQVIYTSQSPTLVSRIGIEAINLLYEDNHSICCYPLANASLTDIEKDYLQKYLDVTKGGDPRTV